MSTKKTAIISAILNGVRSEMNKNMHDMDIIEACQAWEDVLSKVDDQNKTIEVEYATITDKNILNILKVNKTYIFQQLGVSEIPVEVSTEVLPTDDEQEFEPSYEDEPHSQDMQVELPPGMTLEQESVVEIEESTPTAEAMPAVEVTAPAMPAIAPSPQPSSSESNLEVVKRMIEVTKEQSARLIECIGIITSGQYDSHKVIDAILLMDERNVLMQRQMEMTLEALSRNRDDMQFVKEKLHNIDSAVCVVANYHLAVRNMSIEKVFTAQDRPTIEVISDKDSQLTDKGTGL